MENQTKTKLPVNLHERLVITGVKIHAKLKRNGFIMLGSRTINYGFQIRFIFQGDPGCFRIFKNGKNRTTFDFSQVYLWSTIQEIKKITDLYIFSLAGKFWESIPPFKNRLKIHSCINKINQKGSLKKD